MDNKYQTTPHPDKVAQFQDLIKIYNTQLRLRDCYLIYDYILIRDELAKENPKPADFDEALFARLWEKAKERGLI